MNDTSPEQPATPVRRRQRISLIWLIPVAAAGIAGWLGWQTLARRGPMITISFDTADGLSAGRTHVTHKAVDLGTVENINLTKDMARVLVHVRMNSNAEGVLTDHAKFWVVRPRLSPGSISGLETLVSGAYIEMDPGLPGGAPAQDFQGLAQPPGVRSDEPGTSFTFRAARAGSVGQGSPVFLHDIPVGEVLDRELTGDQVTLHAFIRAPFDQRVHPDTRFWNASGLLIGMGAGGVSVQLESLQAVLQGGLAFDDVPAGASQGKVPPGTVFEVYPSAAEARAAMGGAEELHFVTYLQGNLSALSTGSPVLLYGQRIGTVTSVKLEYDPAARSFRVPVRFSVDGSQVADVGNQKPDPLVVARDLLARGLHVEAQTISYITGQQGLAFTFGGPPAELTLQNDAIVIPGQAGGLDNILSQAGSLMAKLAALPLPQMADRLQHILDSTDQLVADPALRQSLKGLQGTLAAAQTLLTRTDAGLTPMLQRLPQIADDLQRTTAGTARLVNTTYGQNSDFQRQLQRMLDQATEAARTVRELADFLDRHPEALVRGRTGEVSTR
jgi:paraquat-inducible protein B